MIISLTPKQDFQKVDDACKAYRSLVDSQVFKDGVNLAITQFVLHSKPTQEQLEGVNAFLKVMLNMAEKDEEVPHEPFMKSISQFAPKPQPKK